MHRLRKIFLPLLLAVFAPAATFAQSGDMRENKQAPGPDLAAGAMGIDPNKLASIDAEKATRANDIGKELVCLCGDCPKRTITDCDCWWAQPNKRTIQSAVAKGMSRDEIMAVYRRVYGDQVLAMIPNEGFARTAWLLPYTVAVLGLLTVFAIGFFYMKRSRHAAPDAPAPSLPAREDPARAELSRELEEMD